METKIQLGNDKVTKIFWTYAIPSIIAMLAQTTAGAIDSIFVGRFIGPEGLSAITLFFPFVMLLIGFGSMFAIGSSTLAGIELGKGNQEKSNNFFNLAFWVLGIFSIIASVIFITNLDFISSALTSGITAEYIGDYGGTISFFVFFFMLNFVMSFFLKLDGKPGLVVKIMLTGTIINIVLDYVFIVLLDLSLKGAALATGLSQLIPFMLFLFVIITHSNWTFKKPIFIRKEIFAIIFNGSSELLSTTAHALAGFVFNIIILREIGVLGVAAYAVTLQIGSIAASIGYGFGEANQAAISFNVGAEKLHRVQKFRRLTLIANLISGFTIFLLAFFFGKYAAQIFVKDAETIKLASSILRIYAFAFIVMCSNISVSTYYTAVNDPVLSGGLAFYRSFIGLIIGLLIFPALLGSQGIWVAIIFSEFSAFVAGMYFFAVKPFGLKSKARISSKSILSLGKAS